jgi:hypothetical protein
MAALSANRKVQGLRPNRDQCQRIGSERRRIAASSMEIIEARRSQNSDCQRRNVQIEDSGPGLLLWRSRYRSVAASQVIRIDHG